MDKTSVARRGLRAGQLAVAVSLSSIGVPAALAAGPIAVNGLLQFENVRVVDAPPAAAVTSSSQAGGMRAYKDSATSELRGPSTEEMQAEATVAAAPESSVRRLAATGPSTMYELRGGGVGARVDESMLQYSVVVRQADGALAETCVTGAAAADRVVNEPSALGSAARKEPSNDR